MLKLLILLLLLANAAYFAWTHGALAKLGLAPTQQTEPERLQQQVQPELLLVTPSTAAPTTAAPSVTPAPAASASAPAN
jgi:hypothetical protein